MIVLFLGLSGKFTTYDAVILFIFFGGAVERVIAWHAHRVLKRRLADLHPTDGPQHQAVFSPGENPEANP